MNNKKQNYYLITCDMLYKKKKSEEPVETTVTFIVSSESENVTKQTLIRLHMYAAKKFVTITQDIDELIDTTVRSISHLGYMTQHEFESMSEEEKVDFNILCK